MKMGAMMAMARFLVTLAVLALPAGVSAQGAGERLVSPPLNGYVVGNQAANAAQSIREEVPRGQTVDHWARMVTTQRFTGLATRATPQAYARTITDSVPRACPGAAVSSIASLTVSGRPAARFQVDCPRNPAASGEAETFILLAIAGQSDMHVKQVAFRGAKTAADLAWARGYLDHTVLCGPRDARAGCR
jgi:hypothetical protein